MSDIPILLLIGCIVLIAGGSQSSVFPGPANTAENGTVMAAPNCDCYLVSGPDPGYFQHYRFWDFRSVPLDTVAVRHHRFDPVGPAGHLHQAAGVPPPILLSDTPFAQDWDIQDWHREGSQLFPVTIVNSNQNVFITQNDGIGDSTYMVLRTTRHDTFSSTAEIESQTRNILHCSVRVRLRMLPTDEPLITPPLGEGITAKSSHATFRKPNPDGTIFDPQGVRRRPPPNGVCAGIFTFFSATSESDIEILTSDPPNRVHYANQPDYDFVNRQIIPGASVVSEIPVPWTSWATHRLDWLPSISRWYVNNELQASNSYGVPHDPSRIIINLWSDGGNWSGNLTVGESVHMGIETIEIAYNNTDPSPSIPASLNIAQHSRCGRAIYAPWRDKLAGKKKGGKGTDPPRQRYNRVNGTKAVEGGCRVGCRIDGVKQPGVPEVVWDFSGPPTTAS